MAFISGNNHEGRDICTGFPPLFLYLKGLFAGNMAFTVVLIGFVFTIYGFMDNLFLWERIEGRDTKSFTK